MAELMDSIEATLNPSLFGDELPRRADILAAKYICPPFSVLNAREGDWQNRKRQWLAMGIESELGRDAVCYQIGDEATWDNSRAAADRRSNLNNAPAKPDWAVSTGTTNMAPGTSIFDPVLCELMYRWFCPEGGQVIDPFAGGSVRGIVAAMLGLRYWGCELRPEQVMANIAQREMIRPDADIAWVIGDSAEHMQDAPLADMVFSCPPYGDLEVYSDDPADLSNMSYPAFIEAYTRIIALSATRLKRGKYFVLVVGEFRDKNGYYRGFVPDTINACRAAGLEYYNEAILVTSVGSLPIRIQRQFDAGQKLGKTHQNILVFKKVN